MGWMKLPNQVAVPQEPAPGARHLELLAVLVNRNQGKFAKGTPWQIFYEKVEK